MEVIMDKICNDILYNETAREVGVAESLVIEVANIQSLFTLKTIKEGNRELGIFNHIKYLYLGSIKANEKKLRHINKRKAQNTQNTTHELLP